jgi:uncharacterized protein (DUF952 family)
MTRVYKILGADEWAAAEAAGVFTGSSIDVQDGYIHLSAADQAQETARLWFAGRESLVLLVIEAELLGDRLKWEASRGGALFPHLYDVLAVSEVSEARPVRLGADGTPDLGALDP